MPIFLNDKAFKIVPDYDLILINDSREKYYTISSVDIINCKHTSEKMICQQDHPIYNTNQREGCEINIIKGSRNLSRLCNIRVYPAQETFIQLHTHNSWLISIPHPEQYHLKCNSKTSKIAVARPSLLTMTEGCTLFAKTATLTAYKDRTDEIEYLSTELNLTKAIHNFGSIKNMSVNTILHDLPKGPELTPYVSTTFNHHHISHYSMSAINLVIIVVIIIVVIILWRNRTAVLKLSSQLIPLPTLPLQISNENPVTERHHEEDPSSAEGTSCSIGTQFASTTDIPKATPRFQV